MFELKGGSLIPGFSAHHRGKAAGQRVIHLTIFTFQPIIRQKAGCHPLSPSPTTILSQSGSAS